MDMGIISFLKTPQKTRMFNFITRTWNPVIGCNHFCSYCWARKLAETKLANHKRYKEGFKPKLIEEELNRTFKEKEFIFVCDMGDLFGEWVPSDWISRVISVTKKFPKTYFLFLTKNPQRYLEFLDEFPKNCVLGATIETNKKEFNGVPISKITKAPSPPKRIQAMKKVRTKWKGYIMISIEPIMDFDIDEFLYALKEIRPNFVVIGKDNYKNKLPEPSEEKLYQFIIKLKDSIMIVLKNNMKQFMDITTKPSNRKIKKMGIEDLDKRLEILRLSKNPELMEKFNSIDVFNEFKPWAPLKLIALSYFVGPYLRIIGNQLKKKYGDELCIAYIDLFAGSGLNSIEKYPFLGSPLLSIDCATSATKEKYFDKMFFVDIDEKYTSALKKRLDIMSSHKEYAWIKNRYKILQGDANSKLKEILQELTEYKFKNCLAFIDPFKWEIKWSSLKEILELHGDILITHQASLIAKEIAKKETLKESTRKIISEYLGVHERVWEKLTTEKAVKDFYIERIKKYKPFIIDIAIKSGQGYKYYLIFGSKRKDPPWKECIYHMKDFVESFKGDIINHCINRLKGKEFRLTDFSS